MFAHSFPQILFSFNLERGSEFSITVYKVMLIQLNKGRDLQQEQQATNNSTWRCSTLFFTFYEIERRSDRQRENSEQSEIEPIQAQNTGFITHIGFFRRFCVSFRSVSPRCTAHSSCQLPAAMLPIPHSQLYSPLVALYLQDSQQIACLQSHVPDAFLPASCFFTEHGGMAHSQRRHCFAY